MNISNTGALKILDPVKWERNVKMAMKQAAGRIRDAAEILGVCERQLYRWLKEPQFANVERAGNGKHRKVA